MARRKVKKLTPDEEFLQDVLKKYADCETTCGEIYREAREDVKFTIGEQWDQQAMSDRSDRPCLVENRVAQSVHQMCNSQRQNRPMIKVSAKKENGDAETTDIVNGFLRHIQYLSDSESAIDWAFDGAVRGGIGWFRITTKYEDDENFEQTISLDRIHNFESVKVPFHLCHEFDCRDMPYGFVESTMSRDDFELQYPDADITNWQSSVREAGWFTDKEVRVCEYFVVEQTAKTIHRLSDGTTTENPPEAVEGAEPPPIVIASRRVIERKIKWYKLSGGEILERADFPGKWIPLIPIIAEEVLIDGKRKLRSFVADAKDPQRMLNYWRSATAERIALAAKAKWVAAATQIEPYENEWLNSNRSNNPVLHYDPVVEGGVLVPAPQPLNPVQADLALIKASADAVDAIKACTGVFDASLGNAGPEKSGTAIRARQGQMESGSFHIFDNCAKALRHAGRIIVDLIPEIFDTERAIKILGEDQKPKIIKINEQKGATGAKVYDLTVGEYDVMVETGPSFLSKQQETAATMRDLSQNDPVLIQSTRDLLAKYLGLPSELVERLTKTIPPNLLNNADDGKPVPAAQVQAMMQEWQKKEQDLDGVIQQAMADVEDLKKQLADKSLGINAHFAETQIKTQAEIDKAHLDNAHELGMAAHKHVTENTPAMAEIINDLSQRLAAIEKSVQSSPAPAPNAESTRQGA